MWMWHTDSWWAWLMMSVGMVAFWVAVAVIVVALLRAGRGPQVPALSSPERILAQRYARGEIDEDEYSRRLEGLRRAHEPATGTTRTTAE